MSNKLELIWVGKEEKLNLESRILIEDSSKSYGEKETDNILIHGDNLLALKALENKYIGRVKCIYIDPPYNTGSAFEHYDDNLEHSIWLNLMKARLEIMYKLLDKDTGTIWITLDDSEVHYCKILCDEIFGRNNFLSDITWNSRKSVSNDAIISLNTNHILVFAKNIEVIRKSAKNSKMFKGPIDTSKFANPDNDPNGPWTADPFDAPNIRPNLTYPIINPNTGVEYMPPKGRCWRTTKENYLQALKDGKIIFGKTGKSKPQMKRYLSESQNKGSVMTNIWTDVDTTTNATKHSQYLFDGTPFTNPKPENLIERVLQLATNEGELVLDSFLGSGTTCAVAHKMKRKWIGIEMGEQAYNYCKKRLDKVIDNRDEGGITKISNWKGGGGYKFYELAPTLINIDKFGEPVINKEYNAEMLASAVALHEGFKYDPSKEYFWKQSKGNENSYLYVTTKFVTKNDINKIKEEMNDTEYLVIACTAYDKEVDGLYKNIKIKKIPEMLLSKCEFGKDNYNLNIINPPEYEEEYEDNE